MWGDSVTRQFVVYSVAIATTSFTALGRLPLIGADDTLRQAPGA